eukprot:Opistho-1_new@38770
MARVALFLLFAALAVQLACARPAATENYRPIIGVLTQPVKAEISTDDNGATDNTTAAYIAASYVKFLESAGARVSIFQYDADITSIQDRLSHVNGFLFPGGGASLAPDSVFYLAAKAVYDEAVKANDAGDFFPLWGTCLGFEFLSIASSGANHLVHVDIANTSMYLNFTDAADTSRLLGDAPDDVKLTMQTEAIAYNNHVYGLSVTDFGNEPKLSSFWDVLSTNIAPNGIEFISMMEAKNYPFYASQWHPEKPQFEWSPVKMFDHSINAVDAVEYLSDFFVNEARRSGRRFDTVEAETAALVYSDADKLKYTLDDPALNDFVQAYVFEKQK